METHEEKVAAMREQIKAFAERYLFGGMNEASAAGEDPNIAAFALLETLQILVRQNIDGEMAALEEFESFVKSYVTDWKTKLGLADED